LSAVASAFLVQNGPDFLPGEIRRTSDFPTYSYGFFGYGIRKYAWRSAVVAARPHARNSGGLSDGLT
jgi:hypothetical protein